ncbi:hypothetical protein Taro_051278 [Colocasia esculenta]|uniref:Uncharacterized protein n=1 Tax=Colocasia esculenta TaxID=4460 RepID=A0A843XGE4_COLES|nr:hypothetical protein [Colocasia esculenta]
MNCAELDPYIEEFDSVILQRNPRLTDVQVEKEREKSFPTWLRSRVFVEQGFITDSRVQEISYGPSKTHKRKGTDDYVSESARTIAVSQAINYEFN